MQASAVTPPPAPPLSAVEEKTGPSSKAEEKEIEEAKEEEAEDDKGKGLGEFLKGEGLTQSTLHTPH